MAPLAGAHHPSPGGRAGGAAAPVPGDYARSGILLPVLPAAPSVCGRLADAPPGIQEGAPGDPDARHRTGHLHHPDGRIDRPLAGAWPPVIAGLCPRRGGVPNRRRRRRCHHLAVESAPAPDHRSQWRKPDERRHRPGCVQVRHRRADRRNLFGPRSRNQLRAGRCGRTRRGTCRGLPRRPASGPPALDPRQ